MTDLQPQLKLLAEKAGEEVFSDQTVFGDMLFYRESPSVALPLPGIDDELRDAECWTVLGWLAKAGYDTDIGPGDRFDFEVDIYQKRVPKAGHGADTLNEALVQAVLALPLEKTA